MKCSYIFLILIVICHTSVTAQNRKVLQKGRITYQRTFNIKNTLKDMDNGSNPWVKSMLEKSPQNLYNNFELSFNSYSSLYQVSANQPPRDPSVSRWLEYMVGDNVVYMNTQTNNVVAQKPLFDKTFLIQDSLPHIQWKITDDFRTIAGYNCRKATAIVMDSLYVIAFYSDAILPSVGPEMFSGLPGAILGLVLPRTHLIYMATQVDPIMVPDASITPPTKGSKTNYTDLFEQLVKVGKNWGEGLENKVLWHIWY